MSYPSKETTLGQTQTVEQLVDSWVEAVLKIRQAHQLISEANTILKTTFKAETDLNLFGYDKLTKFEHLEPFLQKLERSAWKAIIKRSEIKRVMSIKAAEALDKKIQDGEFPHITYEEVMVQLKVAFDNVSSMMEDAVKEVFEFLRPQSSRYKTNTQYDIGKRVILSWGVERTSRGFQVNSRKEQEIRALNNIFYLLDGQGASKSHMGELADAIYAAGFKGTGETEYFKFRACQNHSLHLTFKRPDLVAKLNAVAGGMRLYPPPEDKISHPRPRDYSPYL